METIIKIQNYQLHRLDKYNWVVDKISITQTGKNVGQEQLSNRDYFPKIEQAIIFLFQKLIAKQSEQPEEINSPLTKLTELTELTKLAELIEKSKKEIIDSINSIKKPKRPKRKLKKKN